MRESRFLGKRGALLSSEIYKEFVQYFESNSLRIPSEERLTEIGFVFKPKSPGKNEENDEIAKISQRSSSLFIQWATRMTYDPTRGILISNFSERPIIAKEVAEKIIMDIHSRDKYGEPAPPWHHRGVDATVKLVC